MTQPMIELHGAPTGNCLRVAIALEEAKIPYTVKLVDLSAGHHKSPQHLALNPAGKVPTIVDRSNTAAPLVLSQSNAIMMYLASMAGSALLPPAGTAAYAIVLERFFYMITDVIAPNHAGFYLRRSQATGNGADLIDQRSLAALRHAERFVAESRYMAGEQFSLADIAALTIALANKAALDWASLPKLDRWLTDVTARPGVVYGLAAFDTVAAA